MRKLIQILMIFMLLITIQINAQQSGTTGQQNPPSSFEKIIGKTAANLEQGSFRFGIGGEGRWAGDYSSFVVPFDLSLGATSNIEIDWGVEYDKAYTFVDRAAVREKRDFHNMYGGFRFLLNPDKILTKPAIGFWFGMYVPVHTYESFKPTAMFLLSSAIKEMFTWNFNAGLAYYINNIEYNHDGYQQKVDPGLEIQGNLEMGFKLSDYFKLSTGVDLKIHTLVKNNGVEQESSNGWKWISGMRIKFGDLPIVLDLGMKIGLNKTSDESFGIFLKIQIIPDGANAAW